MFHECSLNGQAFRSLQLLAESGSPVLRRVLRRSFHQYRCAQCSLNVPSTFTECSLIVHSMFTEYPPVQAFY
jgi:hypothetical protein